MRPKNLAKKVAKTAYDKKAEDIVIINLKPLTTVCDYFVICTGQSDAHIKAISDEIVKQTGSFGESPWHKEGYDALKWVLLDYVDIVVHVFLKDIREYYNLERLWGDAKIEKYPLGQE